jgi:cytochrome c oxidase subunit 2
MLQGASDHVETVDAVMLYIVGISALLLVGITAVMIYFVFRYNRKKGHEPVDIHGNVLLEAIWIGIPTILVLSMFYYGYTGFTESRNVPDNAYEIMAKARMWQWEFNYKNGKKTDTLYVPVKTPIKLNLESYDVNHALFIPAFRIKEDVIYGRTNYLSFTPEETGRYDIMCAEYCGLNHSMMYTKLVVMEKDNFESWLNDTAVKDSASVQNLR